eukprot:CAMPEP_0181347864 /NCGR_PEP_ID=MMETSP1101-20121128/34101_1 /TAXON_ID=46948 /ORGANISM="Rhodomonas abbreviata, Strain Caron Lab Isolate" /LENGTH=507 /DNA_ID=CAMNT_0023460097 /DNA_START=31 /DNA_END=1550 /DNA_ORIENTATION=-
MIELEKNRIAGSTTAPLGSAELLTIQSLMHEPTCAADKHCRSACRMVCDEIQSDTGAVNHGTTLISFGCCMAMPIIDKQIPEARTMELLQVSGGSGKHIKPNLLAGRHSLAADMAELKHQEAQQAKRVAKLGLKASLPFNVAKGAQLAFDPSENEIEEGTKRVFSDTDPNGVERQAEIVGKHEFSWKGRECTGKGCPQETKAFKTNQAMVGAVAGTNRYGHAVEFREPTVDYMTTDEDRLERLLKETTVPPYGEPYEYKMPREPSGLWTDNSYVAHAGWERRQIVGCVPNATDDCLELVPARTERHIGYAVSHGEPDLEEDLEKELAEQVPTDDAIKKYLGDDLYSKYEQEEKQGAFFGHAHLKLQEGMETARKRHAFREAFGKSSFEWCLHEHRNDPSFPKACTGDGKYAKGPYEGRNTRETGPEQVLEGVAGAFGNLIGEDHEEHVRDKIQTEAAWGRKQPNQFLYGAAVVQPGHVQADVAPWERIKGSREQPQTVESKEELRRA